MRKNATMENNNFGYAVSEVFSNFNIKKTTKFTNRIPFYFLLLIILSLLLARSFRVTNINHAQAYMYSAILLFSIVLANVKRLHNISQADKTIYSYILSLPTGKEPTFKDIMFIIEKMVFYKKDYLLGIVLGCFSFIVLEIFYPKFAFTNLISSTFIIFSVIELSKSVIDIDEFYKDCFRLIFNSGIKGLEYDELKEINLIYARNSKGYIGKDGGLMYKLKEDMKYFKENTYSHVVIMGMNTFKSMNCKPLSFRFNIIITSKADEYREKWKKEIRNNKHSNTPIVFVKNPKEALIMAYAMCTKMHIYHTEREIWVIGGASIYKALLPYTKTIYATVVEDSTEGDTVLDLPEIHKDFYLMTSSNLIVDGGYNTYRKIYKRKEE